MEKVSDEKLKEISTKDYNPYVRRISKELLTLRKENEILRKRCRRLASAAHNFRVESSDWLHHRTDMLKATISDLDFEIEDFDKLNEKWIDEKWRESGGGDDV